MKCPWFYGRYGRFWVNYREGARAFKSARVDEWKYNYSLVSCWSVYCECTISTLFYKRRAQLSYYLLTLIFIIFLLWSCFSRSQWIVSVKMVSGGMACIKYLTFLFNLIFAVSTPCCVPYLYTIFFSESFKCVWSCVFGCLITFS